MFERVTEREKCDKYPAAPDYSAGSTELFSSAQELTCFATVDTSPTAQQRHSSGLSFFLGPENFVWIPGNPDPTMSRRLDSEAVIALFRSHKQAIHVFVRRGKGDDWVDVGNGLLNGMRLTEEVLVEVNIRLAAKLPEPLWLLLGGHPGWWLTVNGRESEASSPDEVLHAIRDVWSHPSVDLEIGRYAGDTLFAVADEKGLATVNHYHGQDEHVSRAGQPLSLDEPTYIFPRSNGYDHEVSVGQVIPRGEALSLIEDFVLNGSIAGLSPLG
ncbi:hypothetical protein [Tuwongella immobilis]|uniref:Uncharacterized protein n=1 Tax=Tuwongella immobilis TaxID=692036 RepID=A0A6C2YGZ1_9BACT|nr:hypothetical protein [Tuwongella immobilis]VIP00788.1 unnamed protein product [Tuwongella immobilis]VTR96994.1 unnamed protein product [Tuwongella immobilis]